MKKYNYIQKKIGLLGGGQLARMMILKGHELGLQMHVLCPNETDPAAQVTRHWQKGSPDSLRDLKRFIKSVDLVTFESEFLNAPLLQKASTATGTPIKPSPLTMGDLQDRLTQKNLLSQSQFKTSRFEEVHAKTDLDELFQRFSKGFVLKKRRFGYDGYGTYFVKKKSDLKKVKPLLKKVPEGFIAEEIVPFKRELALIVVRNKNGQCVSFPLVETKQEHSRCAWVKGPIKLNPIKNFQLKAYGFLKKIKYEGIIAFELFETSKGLWVNEIAPRVHNSGHFSLDGLTEDQFTLHLKAILNAPLSSPKLLAPGFAMLNLLGTSTKKPKWVLPGDVHLHWYGKDANRKGRKMGHINCIHSSPSSALSTLLKVKREFHL